MAARQADIAALWRSLHHASSILAGLASTEEDIAATFTKLAAEDDPDLAMKHQRLAAEAVAAARSARTRACALRKLAETSMAIAYPR